MEQDVECEYDEAKENLPYLPQDKETIQSKEETVSSGVVYPQDVWFLVAKYIPPEDLGRFALICKDASRVLYSVRFWKQLFHR